MASNQIRKTYLLGDEDGGVVGGDDEDGGGDGDVVTARPDNFDCPSFWTLELRILCREEIRVQNTFPRKRQIAGHT